MADLDALRNRMKKRKEMKSSFSSQKVSQTPHNYQPSQDAEYHYHLAECYCDGKEGYEEDLDKEYQEYLKAAELGHPKAMTELACDYADADYSVLGYDLDKAEYWAKKAIEVGDPDGYYASYKVLEEKDSGKEAVEQLEIGASIGSLDCIEELASLLYWSFEVAGYEVPEDEEKAWELMTSVSWDDEHSDAMELLGDMYRHREDYHKAVEYYEKAIEIDSTHYSAMAGLGNLLRTQEEVRDYSRAKELLEEAAKNGDSRAMNGLGVMFYLGEGCEQDERAAIEWLKKAAQEGHHQAMINLYDILIEEKRDEALYWLNRAAKEGSEEAKNRLEELRKENNSSSSVPSCSDLVYDAYLEDMEFTLNLAPSTVLESNRIEGIKNVIDKGDLSDYEADRLRLLMGWLTLVYFKEHFCDDDFDDKEDDYYAILDKVDDYVRSMSTISDEAAYLYHTANMYSAGRFKDIDPVDKLEELWNNLQGIELDGEITEFKVSFWEETARDVYDLMSKLLKPSYSNTRSSDTSYQSDDYIRKRVVSLVAEVLSLDEDDIYSFSRLEQDLGADSLDAVELIMKIESEFDMTIPDEAAERIRTVGDIVAYIRTHR